MLALALASTRKAYPRFEKISAIRFQEAQFVFHACSYLNRRRDYQKITTLTNKRYLQLWELSEENWFHKTYLKLINNSTVQALLCLPRLRQ